MPEQTVIPQSHVDILENALTGVLTTIRARDGLPSTNPVAFDWDGETIRISTLKSRVKYTNIKHCSKVAFCVVSSKDVTRYIEIRGHAELIDDPEGELNKKIFRRLTGEDFPLAEDGDERVIIKLVAEQVSTPLLYGGKLAK